MKTPVSLKPFLTLIATATLALTSHVAFAAGSITPPTGPILPNMKSLEEIEPRTIITWLPYTISRPGHYYFTNNLTAPNSSSSGITIQANDVTLDLNGFSLIGTGTNASGLFPVGIYVPSTVLNFTMRNGSVRYWGYGGISAAAAGNSRFERLTVSDNRSFGYYLGNGCTVVDGTVQNNGGIGLNMGEVSTVRNCVFSGNTLTGVAVGTRSTVKDCNSSYNLADGIVTAGSCTVQNCVVSGNTDDGIEAGLGNTISGCTVNANGDVGIYTDHTGNVMDCTAWYNGRWGIYVGAGSSIARCVANNNGLDGFHLEQGGTISGCTARANYEDGIEVLNDCQVTRNNCTANGVTAAAGAGIRATSAGNRIEENTLILNDRGLVIQDAGNLIMKNSARYNGANTLADNFSIVGGNNYGTILTNPGAGFTSSAAWANFMF